MADVLDAADSDLRKKADVLLATLTDPQLRDLADMGQDDMPRKIRTWRTLRRLQLIRLQPANRFYDGWILTKLGEAAARILRARIGRVETNCLPDLDDG